MMTLNVQDRQDGAVIKIGKMVLSS